MRKTLVLLLLLANAAQADPWQRHTIDPFDEAAGKNGADGVRVADVNGDGLLDITTGWEQGGCVRICLHPGHEQSKLPWPAVTVGNVPGVEDAVFADLDGDGATDVVTCAEGKVNAVFVHWAPERVADYRNSAAWKTAAFPATTGRRWMYALPLDVNGDGRLDLVIGAKNKNAIVGWLEAPAKPRDVTAWKLHEICTAGWVMSLAGTDINGDGQQDVVLSDRTGEQRGVYWLEHPGPRDSVALQQPWNKHPVGGQGREVMFLTLGNLSGKGGTNIACATIEKELLYFQQQSDQWQETKIPLPFGLKAGKGVAIADVNLDGRPDLITTSEAQREADDMVSVAWLEQTDEKWIPHAISDARGRKFDRLEMIDLDGDGDLDLLTCEEVNNLGVFWYENPAN